MGKFDPKYQETVTGIANGQTNKQADWLGSCLGASDTQKYMNVCFSKVVLE